jgi:Sortilin, neurotensin receptor 3,
MASDVTLLIGRDDGLFSLISENGGRDWSPNAVQLPGIEVHVVKAALDGTVYLGTRGHGLFRRRPGSSEWEAIETPLAARKIRSIAPVGDQVIIGTEAGLGESASPVGVFRWSHMSGWEPLGDVRECSGSPDWSYPVPTEGVHARWVAVDPHHTDCVYAAIQVGGIAITDDGGETWTDRRDLDSLDVHMVEPHPSRPGVVYAGAGGRASGFYRSKDSGDTWEVLAPECGTFVVQFALHPTDANRIYLGAARGHARDWIRADTGRGRGEIFRSDDAGDTWRKLGVGLPEFMESRIHALHIDPENPDTLYFGGGLPAAQQNAGTARDAGVYQSLDGGESWRQIMPMEKGEPLALLTVWR